MIKTILCFLGFCAIFALMAFGMGFIIFLSEDDEEDELH